MLIYNDNAFGIQEFELNLRELFPSVDERHGFNKRFEEFITRDPFSSQVYSLHGDTLAYRSEIFISDKIDRRPPLLILLGNPASHSVAAGMCLAYERAGQEHRFWKLLEKTGLLTFLDLPPITSGLQKNIEAKRSALWELNYHSPFRIGIAVFYSLPSPASHKVLQGVKGINYLLGAKAFHRLSDQEEKRIARLVRKFIGSRGAIIAFQKEAYNRLRSLDAPMYDIDLARQGLLAGNYISGQQIFLAGAPPTREANWASSMSAIHKYVLWLAQSCNSKD